MAYRQAKPHICATALSQHKSPKAGGCALSFLTVEPSLLLDYPNTTMDNSNVTEQAEQSGDAQSVLETGHTVSIIPQEDAGTAETESPNKDSKDWRKSDKEWQQMVEASKKAEIATQQLEKLKEALGLEKTKTKEDVDVVQALTQKIENLEQETALAKWEKSHPAVDNADNREAWSEIVKKKGHLVKSGDLTYDDLYAIIRKGSKPSTSHKDFKDQELNIGSIPSASKTVVNGSEIDPDVYAAMKRAGLSDEQIRLSA